MTNLVCLIRENEKMKKINGFKLGVSLDCSQTDGVNWTFLKSILPELNDFLRQQWKEKSLPKNLKEIDRLELMLKDII